MVEMVLVGVSDEGGWCSGVGEGEVIRMVKEAVMSTK